MSLRVVPTGTINSDTENVPTITPGGGGGGSIYIDPDPPSVPTDWIAWWNNEEGNLKIWYTPPEEPDSSQWVDAQAAKQGTNGTDGTDGVGVPAGGTAGQVLEKIDGTDYNTQWATPSGGGGGGGIATCNARLTLVSGTPIPTTDQTAKTTIYLTPFEGNEISLYSGSAWVTFTLTEISLALGTLTSGKAYDVFCYDNAGTLTLELSSAWTSDTSRNDAVTTQDGIVVKTSATTRRLVGTIYTTSTTTTEDSVNKRYVWNAQNQRPRCMANAVEGTNSWNYTTATWRRANANAANQLDYVTGDAATFIDATCQGLATCTNNNSVAVGIGVNSTSANSGRMYGGSVGSQLAETLVSHYKGYPGLGRNFIAWLEISNATGTTTWYGDANTTVLQTGIIGTIWN